MIISKSCLKTGKYTSLHYLLSSWYRISDTTQKLNYLNTLTSPSSVVKSKFKGIFGQMNIMWFYDKLSQYSSIFKYDKMCIPAERLNTFLRSHNNPWKFEQRTFQKHYRIQKWFSSERITTHVISFYSLKKLHSEKQNKTKLLKKPPKIFNRDLKRKTSIT